MFIAKAILMTLLTSTVWCLPLQSVANELETNSTLVKRTPTGITKQAFIRMMHQALRGRERLGVYPYTRLLFYSGSRGDPYAHRATEYAQSGDLITLWDILPDKPSVIVDIPKGSSPEEEVSAEFARMARGTTTVLLPPKDKKPATTWEPGTIWDKVEWPILKTQPVAVYRVSDDEPRAEAKFTRGTLPRATLLKVYGPKHTD